jgi:hypothetical protein
VPYDANKRMADAAARMQAAKKRQAQAEAGSGDVIEAVRHVETAQWEFADALLATHPITTGAASGVKDGSYDALGITRDMLAHETGVLLSVAHLREVRATAYAWPAADRSAAGPFTVHQKLRGSDDRIAILAKLATAASDGRVTLKAVQAWAAEHRSSPKTHSGSWDATTKAALGRLMKRLAEEETQRQFVALVAEVAEKHRWKITVKAAG